MPISVCAFIFDEKCLKVTLPKKTNYLVQGQRCTGQKVAGVSFAAGWYISGSSRHVQVTLSLGVDSLAFNGTNLRLKHQLFICLGLL